MKAHEVGLGPRVAGRYIVQSECRNCSNVSLDVRLDDKLLGTGEKRENLPLEFLKLRIGVKASELH